MSANPAGDAVDFIVKHSDQARWDIVARAMNMLKQSYTKRMNTDAWDMLNGRHYLYIENLKYELGELLNGPDSGSSDTGNSTDL